MAIVRDVLDTLARHSHAGIQRLLGRDRTANLGRWFGATYRDQPLLFGLVVTWLAFVAVPLVAFFAYATLWAAIAFGVFWAIFLFWAGLGLLFFLVPAVCIATGLSIVAFAWAAAAYYLVGTRVLALFGYESLDDILGGGPSTSPPPTQPVDTPHYPGAVSKTPDGKPINKLAPADYSNGAY